MHNAEGLQPQRRIRKDTSDLIDQKPQKKETRRSFLKRYGKEALGLSVAGGVFLAAVGQIHRTDGTTTVENGIVPEPAPIAEEPTEQIIFTGTAVPTTNPEK